MSVLGQNSKSTRTKFDSVQATRTDLSSKGHRLHKFTIFIAVVWERVLERREERVLSTHCYSRSGDNPELEGKFENGKTNKGRIENVYGIRIKTSY